MASLANNIATWAYGNDTRIEEIRVWQDAALLSIVQSGGQQVVQTSGNGVSVAFASGLSNQAWFNTLTEALAIITNGSFPAKRKSAAFPCDC